jgi:predicted TPR repeat methyltransferase
VREWLTLAPSHPVATHLLASLGGAEAPARAPDAYVQNTFDRFAPDFDATLMRLDYRAPQLLAAAIEFAFGEPRGNFDVLDAGCGTGLCASLLRPFARRLEGVDLSTGMLARAQRRGAYDALHEAELTRFIARYQASWDLIVSADTLCYFGDLAPVLRVAARALRRGGVLAFTLERMDETLVGLTKSAAAPMGSRPDTGQYALGPHGRYAHSEAYVQGAVDAAGFEVTVGHAVLRTEGGRPVPGMVVVARLVAQLS